MNSDGQYALPYQPSSGSSRRAAKRMAPHAASQQQRVLDLIRTSNGITRLEIAERLGIGEKSSCPRVRRLLELGLIEERGERDGRAVLFARSMA